MRIVGNKIYDVCSGCGQIVQMNKFLFGSLHICTTDEEKHQYPRQIEQMYIYNKNQLDKS